MTTFNRTCITVDTVAIKSARDMVKHGFRNSKLILQAPDGSEQIFSQALQDVLLETLNALAESGAVLIEKMSEELTSTVAAETLGVSRPTLMKWVKDGKISCHKVGSHWRFKCEDVMALQQQRAQDRRAAFQELRELDAAHLEKFEE